MLKFTKNCYTGTFNHEKCFASFFDVLRFFWNPKIFLGFNRLEDSKNRISWISEQRKKFLKIIFEFSIRKRSYKPKFWFFQCLLVFPQDFHEKYWKTLKYIDIRIFMKYFVNHLQVNWESKTWSVRYPRHVELIFDIFEKICIVPKSSWNPNFNGFQIYFMLYIVLRNFWKCQKWILHAPETLLIKF